MASDHHHSKVRTVTELTREIQSYFDRNYHFVRVSGEISNLRIPHSGHHYFNLKDEKSQIRAVLFRNQARYLSQRLTDGTSIICDGRISIYEPRGDYQIIVDTIDFQGHGALQLAFEKLKSKLLSEGLFDRTRKLPLPPTIKNICLITSPTGAALHDFLSVCYARNSDLTVTIIPVRVQGAGSIDDIETALQKAQTLTPDVIVLCRGGGSVEDLWTFNEERVARAIFNCPLPVVSAIGHEIDITIADYCADVRSATPTAAAELLVPDLQEFVAQVARFTKRIAQTMHYRFDNVQLRTDRIRKTLSTFDRAFTAKTLHLDQLVSRLLERMHHLLITKRSDLSLLSEKLVRRSPHIPITLCEVKLAHLLSTLTKAIELQLEDKNGRLAKAAALLDSVSPLGVLSRGYSIVSKTSTGEVVSDVVQVSPP